MSMIKPPLTGQLQSAPLRMNPYSRSDGRSGANGNLDPGKVTFAKPLVVPYSVAPDRRTDHCGHGATDDLVKLPLGQS